MRITHHPRRVIAATLALGLATLGLTALGATTAQATPPCLTTVADFNTAIGQAGSNAITLCLAADITESGTYIALGSGTNLTIDLQHHQLSINAQSTSHAAIDVPSGATLTILDTVGGGGVTATGGYLAAGIGSHTGEQTGSIIVGSGTVHATGGDFAAGIGGGYQSTGGTFTMNGGTVVANGGGDGGAGIGGGELGAGGTVTINGGSVTATGVPVGNGANGASGIGGGIGGVGGPVIITGGTVVAIGSDLGAGIGGGQNFGGGPVTISGGTVTATGGNSAAGIGGGYGGAGAPVTISGGTVHANGGGHGAGIGGGGGTNPSGDTLTLHGIGTPTTAGNGYENGAVRTNAAVVTVAAGGVGVHFTQTGADGTASSTGGSTAVTFVTVTPATPQLSVSTVTAGGTLTVTGSGFDPGESVGVYLRSTPVLLATTAASNSGAISASISIPTDTALGAHQIELRGAVNGSAYAPLTVTAVPLATAAATATVSGARVNSGGVASASGTAPWAWAELIGLGGVLLLASGVALRRIRRLR